MGIAKQSKLSVEEYLAGELESDIKHEYVDGEVYAMAGAKAEHIRISGNIFAEFRNHLKGNPCQPFISDMKARVEGNYYYPDVLVDCSKIEYGATFSENPVIIVEVLSESTRRFDKTFKKYEYTKIPSLEEYVLVEQDFCKVEILRRSDHWQSSYYYLGDNVTFMSIDLTLSVEEIYYLVENDDMKSFLKAK